MKNFPAWYCYFQLWHHFQVNNISSGGFRQTVILKTGCKKFLAVKQKNSCIAYRMTQVKSLGAMG